MPAGPVGTRFYRVATRPDVRVGVLDLGLACCALEFGAAITSGMLVPVSTDDVTPVTSEVLVVSGTLTTALVPAVAALADDRPLDVLAFGACAISGGPYWDSPTVMSGVSAVRSVAGFVPGCPPRPQALIDAILALADRP